MAVPEPTRSPSPPPPEPPKALAPGARATALSNVLHSALSHTLRACSYTNFAECFPTPAKYVPASLDGLHRSFVGKLEGTCKAEFQALMEERDVVASLNELDDLIADARRRKERATLASSTTNTTSPEAATTTTTPAAAAVAVAQPTQTPPHLHPPSTLLSAHLHPFLRSQTDELTATLGALQDDNANIADTITSQRAEIEALLRGLEGVVGDLEEARRVVEEGEEMEGIQVELEAAAGVVVG